MARLLRDQGYTATGRAQVLAESGVSNGSLYHHFPGGMEELAEAALEAAGQAVADALSEALNGAPNTAVGVTRFLDIAEGPVAGEPCPGCPIAPTALESPIVSPRLRATASRCFATGSYSRSTRRATCTTVPQTCSWRGSSARPR